LLGERQAGRAHPGRREPWVYCFGGGLFEPPDELPGAVVLPLEGEPALPPAEGDQQWQRVFDTFDPRAGDRPYKANARYPLQGRSVAVFKIVAPLRERRRVSDAERAAEPVVESVAEVAAVQS